MSCCCDDTNYVTKTMWPSIDGHTRRERSKSAIENWAGLLVNLLQVDHANWCDMEMGDETGETVVNDDVITTANILGHRFFRFWDILKNGLVVTIGEVMAKVSIRGLGIDVSRGTKIINPMKIPEDIIINTSLGQSSKDQSMVSVGPCVGTSHPTDGGSHRQVVMEKQGGEHARIERDHDIRWHVLRNWIPKTRKVNEGMGFGKPGICSGWGVSCF